MSGAAGEFDPYEVVGALGRGGMGQVLEVRDPRLPGRRLALKLASAALVRPEAGRRFEREAALLGRVRHPGLVGVHAAGVGPRGPWLVMDLVEGRTLDELLRGGPLSVPRAVELAAQVADAVAALHAAGILHRDLKPENVLLRPDGTPVVIDLGLGLELDAERLTRTGALVGTPVYMAPEQLRGGGAQDARVDVWGLGTLLFALLTGGAPFAACGSLPELVARIESGQPDWPDAPPGLLRVLRRALAKRPAERQPDAAAFARELRGASLAPGRPRRWAFVVVVALAALPALLLRRGPPAGDAAVAGPARPVAAWGPAEHPTPAPEAPLAERPWTRLTHPALQGRVRGQFHAGGTRLLAWSAGGVGEPGALVEWRRGPEGFVPGREWRFPGGVRCLALAEVGVVVLRSGEHLLRLDLRQERSGLEPLDLFGVGFLGAGIEAAWLTPDGATLVLLRGGGSGGDLLELVELGPEPRFLGEHEVGGPVGAAVLGPDLRMYVGGRTTSRAELVPLRVIHFAQAERRVREIQVGNGITVLSVDPRGDLWCGATDWGLHPVDVRQARVEPSLAGVGVDQGSRAASLLAASSHNGTPVALAFAPSPPRPEVGWMASISVEPRGGEAPVGETGRRCELRLWSRGSDGAWTHRAGVGGWPRRLDSLDMAPDGEWVVVGHGGALEVWSRAAIPALAPDAARLPDWWQVTQDLGRRE